MLLYFNYFCFYFHRLDFHTIAVGLRCYVQVCIKLKLKVNVPDFLHRFFHRRRHRYHNVLCNVTSTHIQRW